MSRLDRHVNLVRGKLTTSLLLRALAWSLLGFAGVVLVMILVGRFLHFYLPKPMVFFWSGLAASVVGAVAYAVWRWPSTQQAAVAIDSELGLKEKFSTALYMRTTTADPFAYAAVKDAEQTADNVSLQHRFPVRWPVAGIGTCAVALAALLALLLPQFDLVKRNARQVKARHDEEVRVAVRETLKDALAKVDAAPVLTEVDKETLEAARNNLAAAIAKPPPDLKAAQRRADAALKEVDAIKEKIKAQVKFAEAHNQIEQFKAAMNSKAIEDKGPVGEAQKKLAEGNFQEAIDLLDQVADNLDKMEQKDQQEAAKQMDEMAKRMQQMANDPKLQQQMQDQLQQLGANKQMAQQITKAMQQAAGGDKNAQRQLGQMANQMMQQMNKGQGPTPQQQQQIQNALAQMQQQANNQSQAGQMAQAAQQMAQAMQQAANANQQQGQQQQQQNNKQQPGGQQQQQQNQQQAQAAAQQAKQQMQQCKGQMKQGLQQMQQMQQAMNAQNAGQGQQGQQASAGQGANAGQPGGQPGNGQGQPGGQQGGQPGQPGQPGGQQGEWAPGDPNQAQAGGGGPGGPGVGNGGLRNNKAVVPFAVKPELSPTETDESGKILASTFVKATALKGESKTELADAIQATDSDPTDEVDAERVTRQAREAVKAYFGNIQQDTGGAAAPAGN